MSRLAVVKAAVNFDCQHAQMRNPAMCEKCIQLDAKIEHYQRLSFRIMDQRTLDGIKELIERMKAEKATFHAEQP
jgi:hypothetical protein